MAIYPAYPAWARFLAGLFRAGSLYVNRLHVNHLHVNRLHVKLLLALCLAPGAAWAEEERMRVFGEYEVHYSVFNSSFLSPETAARYDVVRSKNRALLSLAVRKRSAEGSVPVRAKIDAIRNDLIHQKTLKLLEIQEQDAIYYLGQFLFQRRDTLYFEIRVKPEGGSSYFFRFNKELYQDP